MRIGLIVGNGLSIDLRAYAGRALEALHPSRPLTWPVQTPGRRQEPFLTNLPRLRVELESIRRGEPGLADFEVFDRLCQRAWGGTTAPGIAEYIVEARHYLKHAFLTYQRAADETVRYGGWQWTRWLAAHRSDLVAVVSFNYELIVERALKEAGVRYHRGLENEAQQAVPVARPHGSIDFDFGYIRSAERDGGPALTPRYPLGVFVDHPDMPAHGLNRMNASAPNLAVPLVLPAEASQYRHLTWVRRGLTGWERQARSLTHLVIVGISYARCDRPEIESLVRVVPSSASAVVVDPEPSEEMLVLLRDHFGAESASSTAGPPQLR